MNRDVQSLSPDWFENQQINIEEQGNKNIQINSFDDLLAYQTEHDEQHKPNQEVNSIDTSCIGCEGTRGLQETEPFYAFWTFYQTLTKANQYTTRTLREFQLIADLVEQRDRTGQLSNEILIHAYDLIFACRYEYTPKDTLQDVAFLISHVIAGTDSFKSTPLTPHSELAKARKTL